jgi:hypothetical protein
VAAVRGLAEQHEPGISDPLEQRIEVIGGTDHRGRGLRDCLSEKGFADHSSGTSKVRAAI